MVWQQRVAGSRTVHLVPWAGHLAGALLLPAHPRHVTTGAHQRARNDIRMCVQQKKSLPRNQPPCCNHTASHNHCHKPRQAGQQGEVVRH
jgi:hypothetical protein